MFVLKYGLAIIKQKDDNMFHGKGLQRDIIFEVQHGTTLKYMLVSFVQVL